MKIVNIGILLFGFAPAVWSQSLVIPGDFPDPSIAKDGDLYWATATTSNWAPAFPLLSSKDLVNWESRGHTFQKLPEWADYYFWAPEISIENGRSYLYYSAHKKGGGLCVGIASADSPQGPYKDHGPVMCQAAGSIDAFAMRDENGKLYLIWKEDGNSVRQPTPIWAAELDEGRTKVIGEKKELFRNDASWEQNLVEGVSMIRRGEYFYAFYSGAGCCGRSCSYGLGVARSKTLLGPWEKYSMNPVVMSTPEWKCPGHGTPIEKGGRFYFLYHAYNATSTVYTGRQGVLSEFYFTDDNWIEFKTNPAMSAKVPAIIEDNFSEDTLRSDWQWSVFRDLDANQENGVLTLKAKDTTWSFLGQKALTTKFEAETTFFPFQSTAEAGIALIGDENNLVSIIYKDNEVRVIRIENGKTTVVNKWRAKATQSMKLKVVFGGPEDVRFFFSTGGRFSYLGPQMSGLFLPPWDRAIRVGLMARGEKDQQVVFDSFILKNK